MPPNEESFLVELPDPNREALADPRVKSFLGKISKSEGADYNTLVGGRKINDLSRHPNIVGLRTSAGPSTAFGRYQITGSTNKSKLAKYKHLDYSPENQDLRAVELLRQTKALDALQNDDEATAIRRAGREWASLPGSPLPGRKNFRAFRQQKEPSFIVPVQKPVSTSEESFLVPLGNGTRVPSQPSPTVPAPRRSPFAGVKAGVGGGREVPQPQHPYDINQILTDVRTQRPQERAPYRTQETAVPLEQGRQQLAAAHEIGVAQDEARSLPFAARILPQELNRFASKAERAIAGLADYADRLPHPGRGQGPNLTQKISEYLKQRAEISGAIGDYAPEDENLPRTAVRAVANAGMDLASLIAITRATGLPFPVVMAGEAALNNSDKPKAEIAKETGKAYLLGKAYEYIPGQIAKKLNIKGQVGTRALGAGLFGTAGVGQAAYQGADTKHVVSEGIAQGALGLLGGPHEKKTRQGEIGRRSGEGDVEVRNVRAAPELSNVGQMGETVRAESRESSIPDVEAQRFYHKDYGVVVRLEDQSGARRGKLKVAEADNPDAIHYVRSASLSGAGNQRMVPLKSEAKPEAELEEFLTPHTPESREVARKSELLIASKEAFRLPFIESTPENSARLKRPFEVTYESDSGREITKKTTIEKRQRQLEGKQKVIDRLLDCLHG